MKVIAALAKTIEIQKDIDGLYPVVDLELSRKKVERGLI